MALVTALFFLRDAAEEEEEEECEEEGGDEKEVEEVTDHPTPVIGHILRSFTAEENSPENIKSGVGVVRNCLLFDNISKSVVRSPFRSSVHLTQRDATTSSIGPRTLRFVGGWVTKMLV